MTDTTSAAPSDAEIDAQWRESVEKHETTAAFVRDFARAVLAKWGQPTPPAVVPIGWYVTGCSRILDEHDAKAEARQIGGSAKALPLCAAPAVAEPLTDEQIRAMCKQSWVFDTAKQWVRITERAHGIGTEKGESHGR